MTKDKITDAIFDAIERQIGCEAELTDTYRTLGIDSLDAVDISMEVEKTIGYEGQEDLFEECGPTDTIEEIINKTCQKLGI